LKYFKNTELTKLYNVSEKSIRNWIEASQKGKLKLDLYEDTDRTYIADTLLNSILIPKLVEEGRKYRNQRSHKYLIPHNDFYKTYTHSQILDICHEIEVYHEFPVKYRYFNEAGVYWDKYLDKLNKAGLGNLLTNSIQALEFNFKYLDEIASKYDFVNIVNICVGNSLAARGILEHFSTQKKLKRFIAVDISQTMLDITESRVNSWFDKKIQTEKYIRDINSEHFREALSDDTFGKDASRTLNIVLFLAGPIVNFREPENALQTIRESMGKDDLLITTLKCDTSQSRRFFDFNVESDTGLLNYHDKYLLDLLNIQDSYYDLEQFFDESKMLRVIQIRLKLDLSIQFESGNFQKTVHLKKGQALQLWRSWHHSEKAIIDRFNKSNFTLQGFTKSTDDQLILLINKIKSDTA